MTNHDLQVTRAALALCRAVPCGADADTANDAIDAAQSFIRDYHGQYDMDDPQEVAVAVFERLGLDISLIV